MWLLLGLGLAVLASGKKKPTTRRRMGDEIGDGAGDYATTDVRSPTSTSTEVRSPTSTSTEVRSPTSTTTDAYTAHNITVTGGAGAGATHVTINAARPRTDEDELYEEERFRAEAHGRPQEWVPEMMRAVSEPRTPAPMERIMQSTMDGEEEDY